MQQLVPFQLFLIILRQHKLVNIHHLVLLKVVGYILRWWMLSLILQNIIRLRWLYVYFSLLWAPSHAERIPVKYKKYQKEKKPRLEDSTDVFNSKRCRTMKQEVGEIMWYHSLLHLVQKENGFKVHIRIKALLVDQGKSFLNL